MKVKSTIYLLCHLQINSYGAMAARRRSRKYHTLLASFPGFPRFFFLVAFSCERKPKNKKRGKPGNEANTGKYATSSARPRSGVGSARVHERRGGCKA